ncbi:MAG: helix-turn-helix domain-containing protein [Clostridiales bacterium]|nr:MAG: helix-turn-helix domain-containing protein [Clostridiales bacterium]
MKNRGESFSGQELAKKLNVSRNAVWKAVGELKKDGYRFDAVSGRGYALFVRQRRA